MLSRLEARQDELDRFGEEASYFDSPAQHLGVSLLPGDAPYRRAVLRDRERGRGAVSREGGWWGAADGFLYLHWAEAMRRGCLQPQPYPYP